MYDKNGRAIKPLINCYECEEDYEVQLSTKCNNCNNILCVDCGITECNLCSKEFCDNCNYYCDDCGYHYCGNDFNEEFDCCKNCEN